MIRTTIYSLAAGALCALFTPGAQAGFYYEVFSQTEAAGTVASPFLDSVTVKDGNAYAIVRDLTAADTGSVVKYDGSTFTEIMSPADWTAAGATSDIAGFFGVSVVDRGFGDQVRMLNFFDNSIWEVDTVTGTPAQVVSAAMINMFTIGSANLTASNTMLTDGTAIVYDGTSDSILQITPGGFVFNQVSSAELTALTGSDLLSGTGMALVGTDLYFGSNSADALYKWDVITDTGSLVFDATALKALSDSPGGSAGIDDIFYAPDGLVYFYEDSADYIYSFDPADPSGTLAVVLSEADLNAGPGTDAVSQFAWWNGNLAWTDQRDGFYAIPEPTTAVLSLLAVAGLVARRR